jgi:3-oxoacyl-[acyl-carrier protein] reductase
MVNTLKNQLGGLDILINAAGIIRDTEVDNIDPQAHDLVVNTNLKATFNITQ